MPCPSAWLVKPWTKSSAGNLVAGRDSSPSKSRTVLLYWLCVRRRVICGPLEWRLAGLRCRIVMRGQIGGPGLQNFFVVASLADALSAGMGDPVGRLLQEQRVFELIRIDEGAQTEAELFDFGRGGLLAGKTESCCRGDAIIVVTRPALRPFKDGIELVGEWFLGEAAKRKQEAGENACPILVDPVH